MEKSSSNVIETLGGRKFITTVVGLTVGAVVSVFSAKGLSPELAALIVGLTGTFHASNSFNTSKYLSTPVSNDTNSEVISPDTNTAEPAITAGPFGTEQTGQLDRIEKLLGSVAQGVAYTQQIIINEVTRGQAQVNQTQNRG